MNSVRDARRRRPRHAPVMLVAVLGVLASAGCEPPARPSAAAALTLTLPSPVQARSVVCQTCEFPLTVVAEFPVVVGDPAGPGGDVERVRVTASVRGTVVATNTRPNKDFVLPQTRVAAGGTLQVPAGIVIAPAPPPRDIPAVSVLVSLADGRQVVAQSQLTLAPPN